MPGARRPPAARRTRAVDTRVTPRPRRLTVTAVFERHGRWVVAYVPEVPGVNAQERTLRATRASLKSALRELADIAPEQITGARRQVEQLVVDLVA